MTLTRHPFVCLLIFLFSFASKAQQNDSLWSVWISPEQEDTSRAEAMQYYAWSYLYVNTDSAIYFANQELAFSKEKILPRWIGKSYNTLGIAYMYQGKYDSSLFNLERSLAYRKALQDKSAIAGSYGNIGIVYQEISNYPKAIDYYMKSLYYKEEMGDSLGIANTSNNIGMLYSKLGEYDQQMQYQNRSLLIYEALNDQQGVARVHNNLGISQVILKDYQSAEEHLLTSSTISESSGDKHGTAATYLSLSKLYLMADYRKNSGRESEILQKSLDLTLKSLTLSKELQEPRGIVTALNQLALYYVEVRQYGKARLAVKEAEKLGQEYAYLNELKDTYNIRYEVEENQKNFQLALVYYIKYDNLEDSLFGITNRNDILRNEVKFQFEIQAAEDSIRSSKNEEIAQTKITAQEKLLAKEQSINYLAFGLIVILCLSALLIFRRYRITKKQKDIIDLQRAEVAQQHKEILDSIQYAKRLQTGILPNEESIFAQLTNAFLLFKPKDVVSGDFYWFEVIDDKVFIAVADCTGHGVPGAMVSIVCCNALNKAVIEEGIHSAAEILNRARELVIENFEKSHEDLHDGMDISLCVIEKSSLAKNTIKIEWAGANNPLWIARKGATEMEEIKANKQPIGKHRASAPFTSHEVECQKGDNIYLFSDGFVDQFGGELGKKFKAKPFRSLLLQEKDKSMREQSAIILQKFEEWKGSYEQVDDVCMIGIKF